MRRLTLLLAATALLAGCHKQQEESVAVQADKASKQLEQRYRELEAEADNGAAAAAEPFDNEAEALLNRISGNQATENAALR